ncbi:enoyl-CoA hydratase/carnithine racemase [Sistotremastrum niveocremeum HHB9708]|uniref:Enoyl-CoA hydratase/carnithine racemase n=1 Tax=Sistotremastrum niveocremeum HHB9708 TaxID=1314777 RepID=A0A164UMT8_9AGAM|nr:enoyl-CoA hydratase/carnithine racemase [Sistotremastrum niveocremeum HHB9708]
MPSEIQPPSHGDHLTLSYPADHVLLLTMNRPKQLNAMTPSLSKDIGRVLSWFDDEPTLWCAIINGAGRAFCAGADLKAWKADQEGGQKDESEQIATSPHGFASVSRRSISSKPIIAAVHGMAFGGGLEMVVNCDIVIAGASCKLGFPEVKRGVTIAQGAIPRVAFISGFQFASELMFTGRTISSQEAQDRFRFVNKVVPDNEVLPTAIAWAKEITQNSPDSVASVKKAIILAKQAAGIEQSTLNHAYSVENKRLFNGENIQEGLKAFSERRPPAWKNPAKL